MTAQYEAEEQEYRAMITEQRSQLQRLQLADRGIPSDRMDEDMQLQAALAQSMGVPFNPNAADNAQNADDAADASNANNADEAKNADDADNADNPENVPQNAADNEDANVEDNA